MNFYTRFVELCYSKGVRPQEKDFLKILGVASATVTGWKNGTMPGAKTLCVLAKYFDVSTDYLLCLSNDKIKESASTNDQLEVTLLEAFRESDKKGKYKIVQTALNEQERSENEKKDQSTPLQE